MKNKRYEKLRKEISKRERKKKKVREKKKFEKRKKVKEIISDTDGVISSTARLLCQDGCRAII